MTNPLHKLIFLLLFSCTSLISSVNSVEGVLKLMQSGSYSEAKRSLLKLEKENLSFEKRITILRHLGTCSQKLNEEYLIWNRYYDHAIELINSTAHTSKELLGVTHFQKANSLVNSALRELKPKLVSNLSETERFQLIKNYLSPASKSASIAQENHSNEVESEALISDIHLLMWLINSNYERERVEEQLAVRYTKIIKKAENQSGEIQRDLLLYAMIKKCAILRAQGKYKEAVILARQLILIQSPNHELNLEAKLQYAATNLRVSETPEDFKSLEYDLHGCITEVEALKTINCNQRSFFAPQAFFSRRLSAYELLLELYEKNNQIEKMLIVIDQMKARAFKGMFTRARQDYPKLNLKAVQTNLKERNACVVEYFIGNAGAYLFIITPDKIIKEKITCPAPQLLAHIKKTLSGYTNPKLFRHYKSSSYDSKKYKELLSSYESSYALYNLLIKPLEQLTHKPNIIYIVPHHAINYLPFSALLTKLNKSNLLASQFYIEASPTLCYTPSLSLLGKSSKKHFRDSSKVFYRSSFSHTSSLYDLPNTEEEAKNVAKILNSEIQTDSNFSFNNLQKLSPLNVLYIATHIKKSTKPADTGVVLGTKEDLLTVKQLINQLPRQLQANLTILSLCQTNIGEEMPLPGDDIANLSRAFLIAGSRSVVTSQWNVSDEYTPQILQELTTNYHNGKVAPEALDIAIKSYLKQVKSIFYRHPFYWANLLILTKEDF